MHVCISLWQVKHERTCHEAKLEEQVLRVTEDLEAFRRDEYGQLESELSKLRHRYDQLQLSYLNAVTTFKTSVLSNSDFRSQGKDASGSVGQPTLGSEGLTCTSGNSGT